jgi:hypothetical protein
MQDKPTDAGDDANPLTGGMLLSFAIVLGLSGLVWLLAMAGIVTLVAKGCQ